MSFTKDRMYKTTSEIPGMTILDSSCVYIGKIGVNYPFNSKNYYGYGRYPARLGHSDTAIREELSLARSITSSHIPAGKTPPKQITRNLMSDFEESETEPDESPISPVSPSLPEIPDSLSPDELWKKIKQLNWVDKDEGSRSLRSVTSSTAGSIERKQIFNGMNELAQPLITKLKHINVEKKHLNNLAFHPT